ncbi:MAG: DUF2788 domain-containing protein [Gammaproteobacteria bacterium]|nr:MAG: DUF2788 domain-containing protein [Gammaproteobacteria bacterium]
MEADHWLTAYGVPIGLGALIGWMVFIVYRLGKDSKAGRFGMFVLFLALMLGVVGFLVKFVIKFVLQQQV